MEWYAFLVSVFCITLSVAADPLDSSFVKEILRQLEQSIKIEEPIDFNWNEEQISIQGSIDNVVINGLSEFIVKRWFVDAAKSTIEFDISLAQLILTGHYTIDGLLINFFPLQGSGNFNLNIKDVHWLGYAQIEGDSQDRASVKDIVIDIRFGELTIDLDNIGTQSDHETMNEILGVVLVDLFYQYEKSFSKDFSDSIKPHIDKYLSAFKVSHQLIFGSYSPFPDPKLENRVIRDISDTVDILFAGIRINATEGGWDPVRLPSDSAEYNITLFGATANGQVSVSNARLGGFSTIHRTGPCTLELLLAQGSATALVSVGGNDIELGVDIKWGFSIFNTNLQIEMIVRHVDLTIQVAVNTETFAVFLEEFLLNEIGTIKITVGGIPGGGSDVISQRLSLVSNLVKDSLIYAFQVALRPSVEKIVTQPALSSFLAKNLSF